MHSTHTYAYSLWESNSLVQAQQIVDNLKSAGITVDKDKEIVALIAYLQRLGTDVKVDRTARAAK